MSDIFNEYTKLALEKGLIKQAKEDQSEVKNKTNPRYDSLDLESIQMLYGVTPNDKEDETHIMEQAHPESVVVSPSYDRVNGLVENNLERQDVMHYIATKPNHGKHINERYVKARQDLINEVIKTAFVLDRDNESDLMSLADECAERLTKTALWPALAWLGFGALSSMGLINNFSGMFSEGFLADASRAIEEVNDLINDSEMPGHSGDLQELVDSISHVKQLYQSLSAVNIDPRGKEKEEVEKEIKEGKAILAEYVKESRNLANDITVMTRIIETSGETDEPWYSGMGLKTLVETFYTSDKTDAVNILDTLKVSLLESISNMQRFYQAIKAKATSAKEKSELDKKLEEKLPENEEELTLSDIDLS